MGHRYAGQTRNFRPTSTDVQGWRELASEAAKIVLGQSRRWEALKSLARSARRYQMFGPEGRGNVCFLLIEEALACADSTDPARSLDELARLADEVLKRCHADTALRRAERSHG